MSVTCDRQVEVVIDCFDRSLFRERHLKQRAAERSGDLDIAERRNMGVGCRRSEGPLDGRRSLGPQQVFDEGRSIDDDEAQDARPSRSCRMRFAALDVSRTGRLEEMRSKTSSAGGRAISRSRIAWM